MTVLVSGSVAVLTLILQIYTAHGAPNAGCEVALAGHVRVDASTVSMAFEARDRWAQSVNHPDQRRLADLTAEAVTLRAQVEGLKRQLGTLGRVVGFFGARREDHLLYTLARERLRANLAETARLEEQRRSDVARANAALNQHVATLGKTMLVNALLDPPPVWARNLSVINIEAHPNQQAEPARSFTAMINLIADARANGAGTPLKTSRPFTVVIHVTRDGDRVRGGIVLDEALRAQNPYLYDTFKWNHVVDRALNPVAHTSLDQRISQLHLHHVPVEIKTTIMTRQRELPLLRRQVQQVLYAAAKLRSFQSVDRNVSASERDLLKAYLYYWARAKPLTSANMLKSALMIRTLLADAGQQRRFAEVLNAEVDRGMGGFSRARIKAALAVPAEPVLRSQPAQSSSTSESSNAGDYLLWHGFWDTRHGTTDVGATVPFHAQLSSAMGVKSVDDPAFIQNETTADPTNTAVDHYTDSNGHDVTAPATPSTDGGSVGTSNSPSGGDGDGDGDGDGN